MNLHPRHCDIARPRRQRGVVIIGVLFFSLIASILLMGVGTYVVAHSSRARADASYAASIDMAEAAINYEFRKLSADVTQADKVAYTSTTPFGVSGTSFTVQCVNRGTSTAWSGPGTYLDVLATGTVNGISRSIRVASKSYGTSANYALFGINQGLINGTATTVNGDVGTNGFFNFNGHPTINGQVVFNGAGSDWQSPPNGTYSVVHNTSPVSWPTVDTIATQANGSGLSWYATHNDNNLSVPPISTTVLLNGNSSLTLKGKAGGANYYLTNLTCNGNSKVNFDNTAGPITIWVGPAGTAGTFVFSGGTAAVKMSADPTKAVKMYVGTTNDVILNGNVELDAGIYNYNGASSGRVIFNGTPDVYGSVIANKFTLNGNPKLFYTGGYFQGTSGGYYGYDNSWAEVNGR